MTGLGRRASRGADEDHCGGNDGEDGFTLVELLVAISIFLVLSAAVFSMLSSTVKTVNDVRSITNLTEEARLATERITRELRQAGCQGKLEITGLEPCDTLPLPGRSTSAIQNAHLPVSATDYTSLTLGVDFNGDHVLDGDAVDPEIFTYRFNPGSGQLTLTSNDPSGTAVTRPILAANVTALTLTFTSSLWAYDTSAPSTSAPETSGYGITDWTEIDASSVGNKNHIFDSGEFSKIDAVGVTIQLLDGARTQTYTTRVDLRNQNQN